MNNEKKPYNRFDASERRRNGFGAPRVGHIRSDVPKAEYVGENESPDPKKRNAERRRDFGPRTFREEELPENLLYGRNPIREALRAGQPMEKLLVANGDLSGAARDIVKLAREKGVIIQNVDRSRLDAICPVHQGLLAYTSAAEYSEVSDILARAREMNEDPFIVILDGITDPHNLGAIIRTANGVGAHGVIIPERRAVGLTPAAAKTAAGALAHTLVAKVTNINRTLDELKEQGLWVVGTDMEGENVFRADLSGPIALVIGSEGDGISRLTLEKCDRTVSIPMKGTIESLNASVAASVVLYEIARARWL